MPFGTFAGVRWSLIILLWAELCSGLVNAQESPIFLIPKSDTVIEFWQRKGFLEANFKKCNDSVCLEKGPLYQSAALIPDSVLTHWLGVLKMDTTWFHQQKTLPEIWAFRQQLLVELANKGYPLAKLAFFPSASLHRQINSQCQLNLGPYVVFDSIIQAGPPVLSFGFLSKLTGIFPGSTFQWTLWTQLPERLSRVSFIKVNRSPTLEISNGKAVVTVYITEQKDNAADGVIGIAPQSELIPGRVVITGEFRLRLQNLGKKGMTLDGQFQRFRGQSQSLSLGIDAPYIPYLPVGWMLQGAMARLDSTWLDIKGKTGPVIQSGIHSQLRLSAQWQQSLMLSLDTALLISTQKLPQNQSTRSVSYGMEWSFNYTDRFFAPRKGIAGRLSFYVGSRKVIRNVWIDDHIGIDSLKPGQSIYDQFPQRQYSIQTSISIQKYYLFTPDWVLLQSFESKFHYLPSYFLQDYERLGGFKTMRGFDEQSMLTPGWMVHRLELRFLLGQEGYALLFSDMGAKSGLEGLKKWQALYAGGAGFCIKTGAGYFQLLYALGFNHLGQLQGTGGKIHFGLVNPF